MNELYNLEDIIDLVEEAVFLEKKETDEGYYQARGQLILLKRIVDGIYADGNHIEELNEWYEKITHKMGHYFESLGFEAFEDLELE